MICWNWSIFTYLDSIGKRFIFVAKRFAIKTIKYTEQKGRQKNSLMFINYLYIISILEFYWMMLIITLKHLNINQWETTFPLFYYFSSEEQGLELITLCIELITFFYIFSVTSCNTCNLFIKTKSFVNRRKTLIH